eukprot:GFKZ01015785.1.p1 GENE.GFKZ01015785.1~~GFKZ01015785.1.p1  ORF type:complete len:216 (-),score=4.25 GFKZ01015785.1:408-1055(-)
MAHNRPIITELHLSLLCCFFVTVLSSVNRNYIYSAVQHDHAVILGAVRINWYALCSHQFPPPGRSDFVVPPCDPNKHRNYSIMFFVPPTHLRSAFLTSPRINCTSSARPPHTRISLTLPTPLVDRVLVRVDPPESKTSGGLILTTSDSAKSNQRTGTVVSVGPGRYSPEGQLEAIPVKPGDRIMWKDEFGSEPVDTTAEHGEILSLRVFSVVAKI